MTLRLPRKITRVTLEPQGQEIPFHVEGDAVAFEVPEWVCHQMVVAHAG